MGILLGNLKQQADRKPPLLLSSKSLQISQHQACCRLESKLGILPITLKMDAYQKEIGPKSQARRQASEPCPHR